MDGDKSTPFWLSRKFWYSVLATIAFLVLAVTKTVEFSSDQVMTFILALLGITVGGHAASDIGSQIARAIAARAQGAIAAVASDIIEPESPNNDSDGDGEEAEKEE